MNGRQHNLAVAHPAQQEVDPNRHSLSTPPSRSTSFLLPTLLSPPPPSPNHIPRIFGLPLKYVSLMTLALQNASLSILMHHSRVSASPSKAYSAASAVLLNELLKGLISFVIALRNTEDPLLHQTNHGRMPGLDIACWLRRSTMLLQEIFSSDCWKLSIPAILYVIQNNLQFVASANLDVVVFQVSYQMKILTTAAFSVLLLRKSLTPVKWISLLFLAIGVGIVQIQSNSSSGLGSTHPHSMSASPLTPRDVEIPLVDTSSIVHKMHPLRGFMAVVTACFTSGLAGVYFEMVLKGSKADLWVRNVQLSLFSIIPALVPILFGPVPLHQMFDHFGVWAWATVLTQVFGGLVTALVIKYSDNILKGFATSLSIVLSFLASVALFNFTITPAFVLGSLTVMAATWMYNKPQSSKKPASSKEASYVGSPLGPNDRIIGQFPDKKRASLVDLSPRNIASALGLSSTEDLTALKTTSNGFNLHVQPPTLYGRATYSNRSSQSTTPIPTRSHSPVGNGNPGGKAEPLYLR